MVETVIIEIYLILPRDAADLSGSHFLPPTKKNASPAKHFGNCNAPICAFGVAVLALCSTDLYRADPATYPSGEGSGRSNMVGTGQRFRC